MKLRNIGYAAVIAATATAFVIGSAVTSDAKAKKKFEPVPVWETCVMVPTSPVCGARGGMKYTYNNACFAAKDGATFVSDKACPAKAAKKAGKKKAAKKK